ncbi:MAG: tetratricopeptide repeat protein [Treponema sp.]|uniref:tetratricopeptide repeat protein n=1 Tax=Treponema sp. TaxID=166 RepID=UPI003FA20D3B
MAQSFEQAVDWYGKAAEQGYAPAQNSLAVMYETGSGVARDAEKAVYWYRKAAEQGNAQGQYNLGRMYKTGTGVTQSYEQAFQWLSKAAATGDALGQCMLGSLYEAGTGVVQNYQKAAAWYRKAAEQGNSKPGEPMRQTKTPLTDEEQAKLKLLKITDEKLTGVTDKCKLIGSLVIPNSVTEIGILAFTDINPDAHFTVTSESVKNLLIGCRSNIRDEQITVESRR